MNKETRSILTSSAAGAIIGWIVGVAQLIYIGSWELIYWWLMPLIPIYSAVGGALYGMIFGGGGMFEEKESTVVEEPAAPVGRGQAA
jgi:hypothetical protein